MKIIWYNVAVNSCCCYYECSEFEIVILTVTIIVWHCGNFLSIVNYQVYVNVTYNKKYIILDVIYINSLMLHLSTVRWNKYLDSRKNALSSIIELIEICEALNLLAEQL